MDPFRNALNSLSPEDREHYMKLGKQLYCGVNHATAEVLEKSSPPNAEITSYIEEGVKSGLHPNDLSDVEFNHMLRQKGVGWWRKYGYSDNDIEKKSSTSVVSVDLNNIAKK